MLSDVQAIFAEVLDVNPREVTLQSTIDNLNGWDSMKHLELILAIEQKYQINFEPHEVILLNSVERIINSIEEKRK